MNDKTMPPQHQEQQPGRESRMTPQPEYFSQTYRAAGKLSGKVALVTGADSGIGRAVAVHFAKEGASVVMLYLEEHEDAEVTSEEIRRAGGKVLMISGDVADKGHCESIIEKTLSVFESIDILVNNAGEQHPRDSLEEISEEQWEKTFRTNIFGMFQLTKAVLPRLKNGSAIINTTSVTAYKGNPVLLDYSASKGAVTSFTRSLAINLASKGIRVNAVAPGPIWTPLIPSTFSAETVEHFGANTAFGRPGQPAELGAAYVYLACEDSSYMSGQVLHVNGGVVVNG